MIKKYLQSLTSSCLAGALLLNIGATSFMSNLWDSVVEKTIDVSIAGTVEPVEIDAIVTCYAPVPWQTDDTPRHTATGEEVYFGGVAANFLDFDTEIMIPELYPGMKFKVNDRMNSRYTKELKRAHRIDIFLEDNSQAKKCGQTKTKIIVLK